MGVTTVGIQEPKNAVVEIVSDSLMRRVLTSHTVEVPFKDGVNSAD